MIALAVLIMLAFMALIAIIVLAIMDSLDMFDYSMSETDWEKFLSESWKKK